VDGTKGAEAALPYAKEIALAIKAQVTFLHILVKELVSFKMIEVPISEERRKLAKDYLEKLVADFKKDGISADYALWETRGDVGGEIIEYTEKKYVDLVIMVSQGHSGLRYWGIGSVTNKVISEGNAAVMVVKAS
jgi:nucleotide-binding universal stress UspA family protein